MNNNEVNSEKKDEVSQWVTFVLENEMYGIRVLKVQEIQRYSEISSIPGASPHVLGIINLRGNVICVLDTRAKFGLPPFELTDNTRIVILEANKSVIGLLVDGVDEVLSVKQSEMEDAPNVGSNESVPFIEGVCNRNKELLILLNVENILTEDEWQEITNL
jgi:purine-binding chemotaxis protein CheW